MNTDFVLTTSSPAQSHRRSILGSISGAISVFLVAVGGLVITGWIFNFPLLKSVSPDWVTMKLNTAVGFVLAGASLWCLGNELAPRRIRIAGRACAAIVTLVALLTLGEHLLGADFGIDQMLMQQPPTIADTASPGRMSAATAFSFVLIGLSLLGLDRKNRRGHRPVLAFALFTALIGLLAIAGYTYEVKSLYAFSPFSSMAVHTALLFIAVSIGILCARPDNGPLGILTADGIGSTMARRILPFAIILPFLIGWLRLMGERAEFYGFEFGLALFATSNVIIFAALIWFTAVSLNRGDADRKRSENSVREERARLAGLIDSAMDAVITVDSAQRITLFNPAAEKMFGYTAEQMIGQPIERLIPERHRAGHSDHIRNFGRMGVSTRQMGALGAVSGVRADGEEFPLEAAISQVEVDGRKYYTAILRDITERKRAEEALRASEAQLRSFVDQAPASIAMFDGNMICLAASRRWVAAYGRGHDNLVGLSHYEVHPDMPEGWRAIHRKGLAGEAQKCDEDLWIQADGTRNWLRWAVQPWRDFHGGIGGIMILAEDITQGKQIEEEIRETKNFLASIFDNIPNSIFIKDARDLRFVRVNAACEKLTGYSEKEFLGKSDYDFFPKEQAEFFVAKDRETLAGNQRVFIVEESITSKDGTEKILQTKKFPILDKDGHPKFLLGMSEDITERKHAEEAIRQLNTDLERRVAKRTAELSAKNKELETFSYSVSHDLKAPLRGIDGYSRLLLSDYDSKLDEDGRSFLRNIRSATSQMQQLIDDLLAYSKLERRALSATRVDPCMAVEAILNERKHDLERTKLSMRLTPGAVRADPEGLAIALRNLIDNAVKFSRLREKPVIEIESHVEADRYIFSVRDNGAGFDMKYHDRIFQIFQRLHRSEDYSGTGIGLAIVRKAMDRMGGRVWAESESDQGAVFFLDLPCDGLNGSSGIEDHIT